jgi:hypothetical protein
MSSAAPATLARKRALVRSLIEQHGWATPTPRPAATSGGKPVMAQIIQFPMARK